MRPNPMVGRRNRVVWRIAYLHGWIDGYLIESWRKTREAWKR